jgi:hypothetical protein
MRDAVSRRPELKDQPSQPTPHWSELEEPATQGFEREGIQPTRTGVLPPPDGRFSARGFEPGHAGAGQIIQSDASAEADPTAGADPFPGPSQIV